MKQFYLWYTTVIYNHAIAKKCLENFTDASAVLGFLPVQQELKREGKR